MLVRRLTVTGGKRSIVPNVSSNIGALREGVVLFFEAYNAAGIDSVGFHVSVLNDRNERRLTLDTLHLLQSGRNQIFVRFDHSSLTLGNYTLYVQAFRLRSAEGDPPLATTSRLVEVRWRGLPTTVADLDLAVDQLQYIAKEEEIDHIKEPRGWRRSRNGFWSSGSRETRTRTRRVTKKWRITTRASSMPTGTFVTTSRGGRRTWGWYTSASDRRVRSTGIPSISTQSRTKCGPTTI